MKPRDPTRPGPTPIIRVEGDTILYFMWITGLRGDCEVLILRCDANGDVLASLGTDARPRNGVVGL